MKNQAIVYKILLPNGTKLTYRARDKRTFVLQIALFKKFYGEFKVLKSDIKVSPIVNLYNNGVVVDRQPHG